MSRSRRTKEEQVADVVKANQALLDRGRQVLEDAALARKMQEEENALYEQSLKEEKANQAQKAAANAKPQNTPAVPPANTTTPVAVPTTGNTFVAEAQAVENKAAADSLREKLNKEFRNAKDANVKKDIHAAQLVLAQKGFHKNETCPISLDSFEDDANGRVQSDNIVVLADGTAFTLTDLVEAHNARQPGRDCGQENSALDADGRGKFLINPVTQLPCTPDEVNHVVHAVEKHNANPQNTQKLKLCNLRGHNAGELSQAEAKEAAARQREVETQRRLFARYASPHHEPHQPRLFRQEPAVAERELFDAYALLNAVLMRHFMMRHDYQAVILFCAVPMEQPEPMVYLKFRF